MEKKQTAVQWLSDKLCEILGDKCNELTQEQTLANHYAIKQALQMEREHIEEAFNGGMCFYHMGFIDASDYYTQTFKP
jgi:hypothetical protein